MNTMEFAILSNEVKTFLEHYCPANKHFTSQDEVDKIVEILNLKSYDLVDELIKVRNSVVSLYSQLIDEVIDETNSVVLDYDLLWKYTTAMASVTAVLDNYKYKTAKMID